MELNTLQDKKIYRFKEPEAIYAVLFFLTCFFFMFLFWGEGRSRFEQTAINFFTGPAAPFYFLFLVFIWLHHLFFSRIIIIADQLILPATNSKGYPMPLLFLVRRRLKIASIKKIIWFEGDDEILWWSSPSERIHIITDKPDEKIAISLDFYGLTQIDDLVDTLVSINKAIEFKEYDSPETKRYSDIEIIPGGGKGCTIFYRPHRKK